MVMSKEHRNKIGASNKIALKRFYDNGGTPWNKKEHIRKVCEYCGKEFHVKPSLLRVKCCSISCGFYNKKKHPRFIHGLSKTKEYRYRDTNRRRAIKRSAKGNHSVDEWISVKKIHNNRCVNCGEQEPFIKLTEDHIIPLSKGGSDNIDNIQPLCVMCNCIKKDLVLQNYAITAD